MSAAARLAHAGPSSIALRAAETRSSGCSPCLLSSNWCRSGGVIKPANRRVSSMSEACPFDKVTGGGSSSRSPAAATAPGRTNSPTGMPCRPAAVPPGSARNRRSGWNATGGPCFDSGQVSFRFRDCSVRFSTSSPLSRSNSRPIALIFLPGNSMQAARFRSRPGRLTGPSQPSGPRGGTAAARAEGSAGARPYPAVGPPRWPGARCSARGPCLQPPPVRECAPICLPSP